MEKYVNAGYFLLKTKPILFGSDKNKVVETCSGCINFLIFNYWCLSWTTDTLDVERKAELHLTDDKITEIQKWADEKFDKKEIIWGNALPDLDMALTFKRNFFDNQNDLSIYTIYFSEKSANSLIEKFENDNFNNGNFALRHNLIAHVEERDKPDEEFIGFDFIGVEGDGSFHSFYCHNITETLIDKFGLQVNKFGLFDTIDNPDEIEYYLNNTETVEPVPWYIVKTKRIKNKGS